MSGLYRGPTSSVDATVIKAVDVNVYYDPSLADTLETGVATATAQAVIATTQAGLAADQVPLAAAQVALATTQVALATEQVGFAEDQVALAAVQVGLAEDQVDLAEAQVALATTQANNALTSANNAEASFDSFDDRYLGAKTTAPTLDNDGDALLTGALFFDSSVGEMRVWSGTAWLEAYVPETSFVTLNGVQTLTNKTIDLANNTLLGLPASFNYASLIKFQ